METYPTVEVIDGVYTFANLNPEMEHYGLTEDHFYQLSMLILKATDALVSRCGRVSDLIAEYKEDPDPASWWYTIGDMHCDFSVKDTLRVLRKFLPNKADRRIVVCSLLYNFELDRYCAEAGLPMGDFFCYNAHVHQFNWCLIRGGLFKSACTYEIAHGI